MNFASVAIWLKMKRLMGTATARQMSRNEGLSRERLMAAKPSCGQHGTHIASRSAQASGRATAVLLMTAACTQKAAGSAVYSSIHTSTPPFIKRHARHAQEVPCLQRWLAVCGALAAATNSQRSQQRLAVVLYVVWLWLAEPWGEVFPRTCSEVTADASCGETVPAGPVWVGYCPSSMTSSA